MTANPAAGYHYHKWKSVTSTDSIHNFFSIETNNITNNVINLTSYGSCVSFSFIWSGISMKKICVFIWRRYCLYFIAFYLQKLCQTKIYHYIFCHSHSYFVGEKNRFFLLPFSMEFEVWVSAKYAWNLIQLLCYRSAIVLLSSCFFHLQFIKINSYRYFWYGSPRKKKSRMVTATTKNEISNQEENSISFRIFWFDAREREWKKASLSTKYGMVWVCVCVCDYCVCVNCKG